MKSLLAAVMLVALCTLDSLASPGDPRAIQGTIEWPATPNAQPFVVVRGDDGGYYYADVSTAQRRTPDPLGAGSRVAVVGVEGLRPFEVSATAIGPADSATSAAQPAGPGITSAPPPSTLGPPAPPAAPTSPSASDRPSEGSAGSEGVAEPLWQIQGTVVRVTPATMVLDTRTGERVSVEVTNLSRWTRQMVGPGDEVKLFGVARPDGRRVANGFIYLEPSTAAASPRTTR
jgi:hypothetical protein